MTGSLSGLEQVGRSRSRLAGWALAGASSGAVLAGAAALALVADRPPSALILDLGQSPPVAMTIAAYAEAAPEVTSAAPPPPNTPITDHKAIALPASLPAAAAKPMAPASLAPPAPEAPVIAELALPSALAKPEPAPTRPQPRPKRIVETAKPKPANAPAAVAPSEAQAGATFVSPGATARAGGTLSPAAYAKAVLRKVQSTRKKPGAGRGKTLIGFTLATDGALASVTVLQGSGSDSLDRIALDHIRRSAPFPTAPEGAGRSFSFEFVGR